MAIYIRGAEPKEIYRAGRQTKQVYKNGRLVWYRYYPNGYQIKIGTDESGYTKFGSLGYSREIITGNVSIGTGAKVVLKDEVINKLPPTGSVKLSYATSRYISNPTSSNDNAIYYSNGLIPVSFIKPGKLLDPINISWFLEPDFRNLFSNATIYKSDISNIDSTILPNSFDFGFDINKYPDDNDSIGTYDYVILTIME